MSRHQDALLRAREVIDLMSVKRKWPDAKFKDGRELTMFDRARELADAWAPVNIPGGGATRGGSSSEGDKADRQEKQAIERRAKEAVDRLGRAPALAAEIDQMHRDVTYLTSITKERPDIPEEPLAGCRSCARANIREAVYSKSKVSGLCRWCAEKLDEYDDLPIEAVVVRHGRGPKAATLWLQAHASRKDEPERIRCGNYATIDGSDLCCYLTRGHDGECIGVGPGGKRTSWQVQGSRAVVSQPGDSVSA